MIEGRRDTRATPRLKLAPALGALALSLIFAASAQATTQTFDYTGGEQTFTVPRGVYRLQIQASGGSGGLARVFPGETFGASAGDGAAVYGELEVQPGELLYVEVGGNGAPGSSTSAGGFNGGGNGASGAGGGGGASDLRTAPRATGLSPDDRLIVAAGGGGAGEADFAFGGGGGYPGEEGTAGGGAGGATAGGAGGKGECKAGGSGSFALGGNGVISGACKRAGGGGGGGEFGGGAGASSPSSGAPGGGGGGSSLIPDGGAAIGESDEPQITITYPSSDGASLSFDGGAGDGGSPDSDSHQFSADATLQGGVASGTLSTAGKSGDFEGTWTYFSGSVTCMEVKGAKLKIGALGKASEERPAGPPNFGIELVALPGTYAQVLTVEFLAPPFFEGPFGAIETFRFGALGTHWAGLPSETAPNCKTLGSFRGLAAASYFQDASLSPSIAAPKSGVKSHTGAIKFKGNGEPNSTIELYENGHREAGVTVAVNAKGKWATTVSDAPTGEDWYVAQPVQASVAPSNTVEVHVG
jgi:Glycine rich protein